MLAVCPHCHGTTDLPEPWHHPGYTCPQCRAAVPLSYAPAPIPAYVPPPAAAPLDFSTDESPRARKPFEHRNRTRATDSFAHHSAR